MREEEEREREDNQDKKEETHGREWTLKWMGENERVTLQVEAWRVGETLSH